MTAKRDGDRAVAQDADVDAIGGLTGPDLTFGTEHAAFTGDVVLLATDEDRASVSMRALLELADGRRLRLTRTMVVELLYLADLRSVASDGQARSGILWRWWHYGPYCQSLRRVENRLVADGAIKLSTSRLSADVEEAVLSSARASSGVAARAGVFMAHLEAVLEDHGRTTAGASTDLAYQTAPMIEAQRAGERGVLLNVHHVYEIELESPQMWIKLQTSGTSLESAKAFLEYRFGGNDPDPDRPDLRYVSFSFRVPRRLSECVGKLYRWLQVS